MAGQRLTQTHICGVKRMINEHEIYDEIKSFRNEYFFLSNMYNCDVIYNGYLFNSAEAAYMSAKNNSDQWLYFCLTNSPYKIKKESNRIKLVDNWDSIKLKVMNAVVRSKFSNEIMYNKLKSTIGYKLIEGNWWGDEFWGVDNRTGKGKNYLGKILMNIREEDRHGKSKR